MVTITAEIGINHNGQLERAVEIIRALAGTGVDVIKFQKMEPRTFLSPEEYQRPHPKPENAFGETYGAHREFLELRIVDHANLKRIVESYGMRYACSVCDIPSARMIIDLNPAYIKIPGCAANRFDLVQFVYRNYSQKIHISTGMTGIWERRALRAFVSSKSEWKRFVLYNCTSNYESTPPVYMEPGYAGFSCHYPEPLFGGLAAFLGAKFLEYHVTLDPFDKGGDHIISLLPDKFRRLREIVDLQAMVQIEKPDEVPENEKSARAKLWRGVMR